MELIDIKKSFLKYICTTLVSPLPPFGELCHALLLVSKKNIWKIWIFLQKWIQPIVQYATSPLHAELLQHCDINFHLNCKTKLHTKRNIIKKGFSLKYFDFEILPWPTFSPLKGKYIKAFESHDIFQKLRQTKCLLLNFWMI